MPNSKITWRMRKARMEKLKIVALQPSRRSRQRQILATLGLRQHLMTAEIGIDPLYLHELTRDMRERLRRMWKADQAKWLRAHPAIGA